jgi:uncharacterized protein YecE (DUF72 family)
LEIYTGCSGWSYTSWQGPFYPPTIENKKWLPYYSKVFDYVEIDSTFYRIPSKFMVQNWAKRTPYNFRFTTKFPKIITHDKRLRDVHKELGQFYDVMEPLADKTLALLIQLPPSLQIKEGLDALRELDFELEGAFRYPIEVRHPSWYNELLYNFLKSRNICLVWSQQDRLTTPPVVTSDLIYLRLIGDRSIDERDFGKIQRDRVLEMQRWVEELKSVQRFERNVKVAIVSANNHYAGFGPGTVKTFREMMELPGLSWEDKKDINQFDDTGYGNEKRIRQKQKQTSISNFLS